MGIRTGTCTLNTVKISSLALGVETEKWIQPNKGLDTYILFSTYIITKLNIAFTLSISKLFLFAMFTSFKN